MTLIDSLFFIPCLILVVLFIREIKKRGGFNREVRSEILRGVAVVVGAPALLGLMCLIGYGYQNHMPSIIVPHLVLCLIGLIGGQSNSDKWYVVGPTIAGLVTIVATVLALMYGGIFSLCNM